MSRKSFIDSKERIEDTLVKPLIYGNRAYKLPVKNEKNHTHRWTVYIRGVNNESLSSFVRKVQFKIHTDYEQPVRVVEKEPFELSETGWGEFMIQIKIFMIEKEEKQAMCQHYLRLHQPETFDDNGLPCVISEIYDELIFVNPYNTMYEALLENVESNRIPETYQAMIKEIEDDAEKSVEQTDREVKELIESIKKIEELSNEYRDKLKALGVLNEIENTENGTGE